MTASIASGGGGSANYVSDAEIMAWVEEQQNAGYGRLRDAMAHESVRGSMLKDLGDIKKLAKDCTKDLKHLDDLNAAVKAFAESYGGIEEFKTLTDSVADLAGDVKNTVDGLSDYQQQLANPPEPTYALDGEGNQIAVPPEPPKEPGPLDGDKVKEWTESVTNLGNDLSHNQDLAMINIGELRNTVDNIAKTGSQLLKGANDAASLIINNYA